MIKTDRLVLVPVSGEYIDRITELLQDEDIHQYLERMPYPYAREDAEEFVRRSAGKEDGQNLFIKLGDEVVGGIALMKRFRGRAEVGYWLGKPYWGRGIVTEALAGLLEHFSGEMDLVTAHVAVPNVASQRVLEKNGFRRLAMLPRYHRNYNGEVHDAYFYLLDLR
jgi:RimJ/RimL family protein N-acetyltransferase